MIFHELLLDVAGFDGDKDKFPDEAYLASNSQRAAVCADCRVSWKDFTQATLDENIFHYLRARGIFKVDLTGHRPTFSFNGDVKPDPHEVNERIVDVAVSAGLHFDYSQYDYICTLPETKPNQNASCDNCLACMTVASTKRVAKQLALKEAQSQNDIKE